MKLAGQDLDFSASGNLSANDVTATGNVKLASSTGAISVKAERTRLRFLGER